MCPCVVLGASRAGPNQASLPAQKGAEAASSWKDSSRWQEQSTPWKSQQSSWGKGWGHSKNYGSSSSWQGSGGNRREKWDKPKGWNKWPKPEQKPAKEQYGRGAAPKEEEPEILLDPVAGIFGTRQQGPPERPDSAFNVAEATEEEVQAAANRKAEREEEGFHSQLWQGAIAKALADPSRPKCARELMREGILRSWWNMSWKDARGLIDGTLADEYRDRLMLYMAKYKNPTEVPQPIVERCACLFAWFKQNSRQLDIEGDFDAVMFAVPGQKVLCFRTKLTGPSFLEPANHRYTMTMSHGLPWTAAMGVGEYGEITPGDFTDGDFPSYGFSGRGVCNDSGFEGIKASISKVAARAKGRDVIFSMEGLLQENTPQVEGGMPALNAACRDAGSARSGDHLLLSPTCAVLRAVSVAWPI